MSRYKDKSKIDVFSVGALVFDKLVGNPQHKNQPYRDISTGKLQTQLDSKLGDS